MPFKAKKKEINPTIQLDIPSDLPIILYQGAVNLGRGIEEAILAMKSIDNARFGDCLAVAIYWKNVSSSPKMKDYQTK